MEGGALKLTVSFVHSIRVLTHQWAGNQSDVPEQNTSETKWRRPVSVVEVTRDPLLFTFSIAAKENVTDWPHVPPALPHGFGQNDSKVQKTTVTIDNSKPWQIVAAVADRAGPGGRQQLRRKPERLLHLERLQPGVCGAVRPQPNGRLDQRQRVADPRQEW